VNSNADSPIRILSKMKPLKEMTEQEMIAEVESYPPLANWERQRLENELYLNHYIRGWTGDPLCQPARVVLAIMRRIKSGQAPL
jgi:hypothetical protein